MSSPWISPDQWINLSQYYAIGGTLVSDVDRIHRITVWNDANPVHLLDSGATNTITLQVFARLVDPVVAGHVDLSVEPSVFTAQMKGFGFSDLPKVFDGFKAMSMDWVGRGTNPNDEFRDEISEHIRSTESGGKPKVAPSPSYDPDEPELKPNLYGSMVCSNPKYVLGTGNQTTGTRDYTILSMMRIPTIITWGTVDSAAEWSVHPDPDTYSRISYLSQMYRMWRGGIEYTIIFFSSPFVTARLNLVLTYPGDLEPSIHTLGNKVIQDITIRGTTRVAFTVPYLFPHEWQATPWQEASGYARTPPPKIQMFIVSPPESIGDVVPEILFVVYETAAPDFRFRSLTNPSQIYSAPPFEAQMRTASFVKSRELFNGRTAQLGYPDDTEMTVSGLLSRWSYSTPGAYHYPMESVISTGPKGVFSAVCQLFLFWSGQVRHKMMFGEPTDPTDLSILSAQMVTLVSSGTGGVPVTSRVEDGMTIINQSVTQVLEVTVPFLSANEFESTYAVGAFRMTHNWRPYWTFAVYNDRQSINPTEDFVAAGPDFSLYYPMPPPPLPFWSQNATAIAGLEIKKPQNFGVKTVSLSEAL
jgi:hypothetical protein